MYFANARKLPATDTQGAKIIVVTSSGQIHKFPYDYDANDPFMAAVERLVTDSNCYVQFDKMVRGAHRYAVISYEEFWGVATPDNPVWMNSDGTTNHEAIAREWE